MSCDASRYVGLGKGTTKPKREQRLNQAWGYAGKQGTPGCPGMKARGSTQAGCWGGWNRECGDRMRGAAGPVCPGGVEVPTKVKRLDFIQRETDNQGGFQQ